jgi:hypothetical protein
LVIVFIPSEWFLFLSTIYAPEIVIYEHLERDIALNRSLRDLRNFEKAQSPGTSSSHILLSRGVAASDIEPTDFTVPPVALLTSVITVFESESHYITAFGGPATFKASRYIQAGPMAEELLRRKGRELHLLGMLPLTET